MSISVQDTRRSDRSGRIAVRYRGVRPPAETAAEPRTFIVGYDRSDEARAAFAVAVDRSRPDDTVVVVHATTPASSWLGTPYYQRTVEAIQRAAENVLNEMRRIAEQVDRAGRVRDARGLAGGRPHPRGGGARRARDHRRLAWARPPARRARERLPGTAPRGGPARPCRRPRCGNRPLDASLTRIAPRQLASRPGSNLTAARLLARRWRSRPWEVPSLPR